MASGWEGKLFKSKIAPRGLLGMIMIGNSVVVPCFPDNKTGLILIFTPKYGTRAYFRGMYYFDISKNEVTK